MARGFLAGLVHGGLLSVAALAGLSLLAPLPRQPEPVPAVDEAPTDPAPAVEPEPVEAQPDVPALAPADAAPLPSAPGETASVGTAPEPETLDLPAGSEFGRAGDLLPVLPVPGGAAPRAELAEPPAAPTQDAGTVPPIATGDPVRPETEADTRGPALPQSGEDAPALTLPSPSSRSVPRDAPATLSAPAPDVAQDALPHVAPEAAASPEGAPRLPSPALDLSLPPDLTDIRRLERD
ncbi:hypothetical protein [Paracoccus beibuensis]|uniref:hypothetical protein n=1 Tax=Paracoccus beibuensis TaxID=547602 RepID=UPI00223E98B5|nr:hypothetical protein [Paracoccus beibuensis]